jgi:predicted RNase H-like nuclease (RuvC/YqgF family)
MEGVLALMIPIVAIATFGMWVTGIGAALARRIGGRAAEADHDQAGRIEQLERDLDDLRLQLSETQERVDFAERMLAQVRDAQRLPPAGG